MGHCTCFGKWLKIEWSTSHLLLSSLCYFFLPSATFHSTFWVPKILHWAEGLHPMCGGLRGLAHHHHLAEGWAADPGKPRGDHWQHWLHQLPEDLQPLPDAQWELHLHRPERGRSSRTPESADCKRWVERWRPHVRIPQRQGSKYCEKNQERKFSIPTLKEKGGEGTQLYKSRRSSSKFWNKVTFV